MKSYNKCSFVAGFFAQPYISENSSAMQHVEIVYSTAVY